jgi:uncharacterized protein HemY
MPIQRRTDTDPAWFLWLIAIPIAIVAAFLAFFFLTFFLIAAAVAAAGLAFRLWWLKRKLRRAATASPPEGPQIYEGEYRVLYEERRVGARRYGPAVEPEEGGRK